MGAGELRYRCGAGAPANAGGRLSHPVGRGNDALAGREVVFEQTWCSVGGGFVVLASAHIQRDRSGPPAVQPHPFHDCASLVAAARSIGGTFGDVVLADEEAWDSRPGETTAGLDRVCDAFRACITRGLQQEGELPGGLGVRRRAAEMLRRVEDSRDEGVYEPVARAQAYALVQAPCIERNALGVAKAWSAAYLSLHSVVSPVVSLDRVIQVMKRTGDDMRSSTRRPVGAGWRFLCPNAELAGYRPFTFGLLSATFV